MSLPTFGPPPPTHAPIPPEKLQEIARPLAASHQEGSITFEDVERIAAEKGVPRTWVLATAGLMGLRLPQRHEVAWVACVGGCQAYGALERLEQLLRAREQREQAGARSFDIHPVRCLDACMRGPVLRIHTPEGVAMIDRADEAKVAAALAELA